MTQLLRLVAFAIALAGLIDPAISVSGASRPRIAIVVQQPASPAAAVIRDRLARTLGAAYEIVPWFTSAAAAAIVIGDRYPDESVPDALVVATVTTAADPVVGLHIVRVDAPREIPPATAIHLDVEVEGSGLAGQTTDVTAVIVGLEVGRASHRWAAGETRWRAGIDAVPVGEPPFVVRVATTVRLKPDTTDASVEAPVVSGFSRTGTDVVVDVRRAPFRVQFYDPRPSWATTFLRRALEADARFQVAALSFTSRGISEQIGGAVPLADPRLEVFDVVIVGGLDGLSADDARSLERYMRERGGSVVVVPDQRIDPGPARELIFGPAEAGHYAPGSVRLQPDLTERLLEQPATLVVAPPVASLQASELLVLRALPPASDVVARIPGSESLPVIVSMPRGAGRLLLSGAMDAWRFRARDNSAFDRFWQSTIAGLAMAAPPPIDVSIEPPLLRPGERGDVFVRTRARDVTAVSALIDGDQPIRLRPEPEAGVYRGTFTATSEPGRSTIEVRSSGAQPLSVSRKLIVQPDVQRVRSMAAPSLSMLAASHRGIDVTPEHINDLEQFVRTAVSAPPERHVRHPMRSTWWILPFTLCLSAEWWLRRRRGLR